MKYVLRVDRIDVGVFKSVSEAQAQSQTYSSLKPTIRIVAMAEGNEIAEVQWWYYDYVEKDWVKGSGSARD